MPWVKSTVREELPEVSVTLSWPVPPTIVWKAFAVAARLTEEALVRLRTLKPVNPESPEALMFAGDPRARVSVPDPMRESWARRVELSTTTSPLLPAERST